MKEGEAVAPDGSYSLEFPNGESNLQRAVELISSLICISHSIRVFSTKWQLIRNKLEKLNSILMAATDSCSSLEDTPLPAVIQSILVTALECRNLARRCTELSYSGKLLMQSELDGVLVKFECSLKDLNGIYSSGILTQAHAIVVSRPIPGAGLADMKFYVGNLLTRLKIGNSKMKLEALIALNEILGEDEKYTKTIVETGEIVRLLVNFLEFVDVEIQEESTCAVSMIAGFDNYKGALVEAGVFAPLIWVLEIGSDVSKERATAALQKLTENSDNVWLVSAHGGITALLKICNSNSHDRLISSACGVLRNLAGVDEIKRFMIEEGAISTFVGLSRSNDEVSQIHAIEFLQEIASGDETIRQMIIREGGIQSLIRVLDPMSSLSSKSREVALRTIDALCFLSPNSVKVLMGSEFLNRVLFFIRKGDVAIQESALKTAFRFCGISVETKKVMGKMGFMPELVQLLDAKSLAIREMSAEALLGIISIPKNRKKFIQEDSNIVRVLELLDSKEEKSGHNKILLSLIMSLTDSEIVKRKIIASGCIKYLEKLAEAEVTDAKRIIRKLSENRFRRMLNGIWSSMM
ncbi:uncharacterized protein LOC131221885 [Magnolia sinica]|uniref:uncharacterized protein LOC131221885 n=1 Tax=Magnolia sinica TaxID=86752 RepID=UPI002658AA41|nr:uncharacterized protein LOC131221885 [Magnolia sinica]